MSPTEASLASLSQRAGAWIIDAIPYVVAPSLAGRSGGWIFSLAAFLIVGIAWTILPEGRTGMTPGKRLLGLRTLDIDTAQPIGLGRSTVRWATKYIGLSFIPIGYLWCLRSPERQTIADVAARTVVVVSLPAADGPGSD